MNTPVSASSETKPPPEPPPTLGVETRGLCLFLKGSLYPVILPGYLQLGESSIIPQEIFKKS